MKLNSNVPVHYVLFRIYLACELFNTFMPSGLFYLIFWTGQSLILRGVCHVFVMTFFFKNCPSLRQTM